MNNLSIIENKAKEYQQIFTAKMLNSIFENIKFDPFSEKQSIFKSLLIDEYAKHLAPSLGIDKLITKTLLDVQEIQNNKDIRSNNRELLNDK